MDQQTDPLKWSAEEIELSDHLILQRLCSVVHVLLLGTHTISIVLSMVSFEIPKYSLYTVNVMGVVQDVGSAGANYH